MPHTIPVVQPAPCHAAPARWNIKLQIANKNNKAADGSLIWYDHACNGTTSTANTTWQTLPTWGAPCNQLSAVPGKVGAAEACTRASEGGCLNMPLKPMRACAAGWLATQAPHVGTAVCTHAVGLTAAGMSVRAAGAWFSAPRAHACRCLSLACHFRCCSQGAKKVIHAGDGWLVKVMFRRNNASISANGNAVASFSRFPQSASQQPWELSHIEVRMDIANQTADDRGWRKKNGLYPMVSAACVHRPLCMQQPASAPCECASRCGGGPYPCCSTPQSMCQLPFGV